MIASKNADLLGVEPADTLAGRWSRTALIVLGIVVISMGMTVSVIRQSYVQGRLGCRPIYDDSSYLRDGILRLEVFNARGWWGLGQDLSSRPPHAPYSSMMAMASFGLLGREDWAPYASNIVIVLATLLYVARLARRLPGWGLAICVSMVLVTPLVGWSIHEFRPDLACGLATAIVLCEITLLEPERRTFWRAAGIGLLLVVAVWIKVSVFPVTFLLTTGALLVMLARDLMSSDRQARVGQGMRFGAVVLATGAAGFAPYLYVGHERLFAYIAKNMFGHRRQFWVWHGDWWSHFRYYIDQDGGRFAFGRLWCVLPLWIPLGIIALKGGLTTGLRGKFLAFSSVTAGAFLIPFVNEVKSPFFGAVYYYLVVFGCVLAFAWGVECWQRTPLMRSAFVALAGMTLYYGGMHFEFPRLEWRQYAEAGAIQDRVYEVVRRAAHDNCRVCLTTTGFVNAAFMKYALARDGLKNIKAKELWMYSDLDDHRRAMQKANVIIASEPGTGLIFDHFPSAAIQTQTLELARQMDGFVEIGTVPTQSGSRFHVFARSSYLAGRKADSSPKLR